MIIYLCAFINKYYIEEAMVCIESIRKNGKFTGDIYLFTDMDVLIDNVKIVKTTVECVYLSASYRLRFFEHIKLNEVKNEIVLYLDTDIVVLNEIPTFDNINNKIQTYGYPNRRQIEKSFAGAITDETNYTDKVAISSGILLFRASTVVKKVFDETYELYLELINKEKVTKYAKVLGKAMLDVSTLGATYVLDINIDENFKLFEYEYIRKIEINNR
jgi:lipopolysaccharide biosynthesis glycosyltransferase